MGMIKFEDWVPTSFGPEGPRDYPEDGWFIGPEIPMKPGTSGFKWWDV